MNAQERAIADACESIDAAVFSGDVLYQPKSLDVLRDYVSRWDAAIKKHDAQEEELRSFLIYSPNEAAAGGGSGDGFWSNEDGWTTLEGATRFSQDESQNLNLPISLGQDASWMSFPESEAQCADNDLKFAGIDTLSPAVDHLRPRV